MKTPVMKKRIGIEVASETVRTILFYTDSLTVDGLHQFGDVKQLERNQYWRMVVDARFDFKEVLSYMEQLEY